MKSFEIHGYSLYRLIMYISQTHTKFQIKIDTSLPEKHHPCVVPVVLGVVGVDGVDAPGHEVPVQPAPVGGHGLGRGLEEEEAVTVVLLGVAGQGQAPAEEGEVPHVDEGHRGPRVQAEDTHAREGSDYLK